MSGRQNSARPEVSDEDDDLGEFGGFEAADPLEVSGIQGGQAISSSWAAFASASAVGRRQPDLLCAQNTFPTYLDPSGIADVQRSSARDQASSSFDATVDAEPSLFDVHFSPAGGEPHRTEAQERPHPVISAPLADVLDGTFDSAPTLIRNSASTSFVSNGMLPDIGLGSSQNPMLAELPLGADISQNAYLPDDQLPELDGAGADVGGWNDQLMPEDVIVRQEPLEQVDAVGNADRHVIEEVEADNNAQHSRMERELASIQSSNLALTLQLERYQADLATQRSRLRSIEEQHAEQLEAVRQSGHDALAVVVEQYKELSRTAVLEQQETNQRHMLEVMKDQNQAFQQALQAQKEESDHDREKAVSQMQHEFQITLETMRTEQNERFQEYLAEERKIQQAAITQAIEEERVRSQEQIQEAIREEQRKAIQKLEEAKEEFSRQLEVQKQLHKEQLEAVHREERQHAKEHLAAFLEEERQRAREMMDRALQEARQERDVYVQQQRQSDAALRRRHLASIDLFLESARRQVDLLLNSELNQIKGEESKDLSGSGKDTQTS